MGLSTATPMAMGPQQNRNVGAHVAGNVPMLHGSAINKTVLINNNNGL